MQLFNKVLNKIFVYSNGGCLSTCWNLKRMAVDNLNTLHHQIRLIPFSSTQMQKKKKNAVLQCVATFMKFNSHKFIKSLTEKWMMIVNFFVIWLTDKRYLALFPAGTIVKDPHHRESPTRHEQGLNLRRT